MDGDTWTTSGGLQILFYGAIISNGHQRRRLNRQFPGQFATARPWLGVIMEKRDDPRFLADFEQAIAFLGHQDAQRVLHPHFDGVLFIMICSENGGWATERTTVVRW